MAIEVALDDVGAVIRAYTRSDETGSATGTFDDTTDPTGDQVEEFIAHAVAEVKLRLPDDLDELHEEVEPFANRLAAIRAAMLVIVALQSDENTTEDSAYARLATMWNEGWRALSRKLEQTGTGGLSVGSIGLQSPFSGPDVSDIYADVFGDQ